MNYMNCMKQQITDAPDGTKTLNLEANYYHFQVCRRWTKIIDLYNQSENYSKHSIKKLPYFTNFTKLEPDIFQKLSILSGNTIEKLNTIYSEAKKSRDWLVERYIPYAKKIVRLFKEHYVVHLEDDLLENTALWGLTKAVERFEPERGNSFITYAKSQIWRQLQIVYHQEQENFIAIPEHQKRGNNPVKAPKVLSFDSIVERQSRKDKTSTIKGIDDILELKPLWDATPSPELEALYQERRELVRKLLTFLDPKEQELIEYLYGLNGLSNSLSDGSSNDLNDNLNSQESRTMTSYARKVGKTPASISQQHGKIIKKLRKKLEKYQINSDSLILDSS